MPVEGFTSSSQIKSLGAKAGVVLNPSPLVMSFDTVSHLISQIKSLGAKAGVVLNPSTLLTTIEYVLDVVDLVLIMSVNPEFGGQSFIESQVKKISDLRRMCAEKRVNSWIEVDGGVGPKNAYKVIEVGTNALFAGSSVFGAKDYADGMNTTF